MAEAAMSTSVAPTPALLFWLAGQCCALAADRVIRVVPAQPLAQLPFLPPSVLGVAAIGGKVVPVLNLRRLLQLPDTEMPEGELLLIAAGSDLYAARVDRVGQIIDAGGPDMARCGDGSIALLDLDALLARALGEAGASPTLLAAIGEQDRLQAGKAAAAAGQSRATGLLVETAAAQICLPLDCVVELFENLPIAAVPDPRPVFAGAAFYRGALLPVVRLAVLLGHSVPEPGDSGVFVIVDVAGRRCALKGARVIGQTSAATPSMEMIDLHGLLSALLPATIAPTALPVAAEPAQQPAMQFLLAELSGRICGFELSSVAHLHAGCRMISAPAGTAEAMLGVTAIGGRVLPVIDLAARLGLAAQPAKQHFIELKAPDKGHFVIAAERIIGIAAIARDAMIAPPPGSRISALVRHGTPASDFIWLMDGVLIGKGMAGGSHAS
jgi:purine-binding chemotaxis protein CheW